MSKNAKKNAPSDAGILAAAAIIAGTTLPATAEVVAPVAPAAPVVVTPKEPSKKSRATAIFTAKRELLASGEFKSNKEFRQAVLRQIEADLGVTVASASTMYNAAKAEAEKADPTFKLGRDPKKEKAPSTGKRGRPAGSKNAPKIEEVAATTEGQTVVVETASAEVATEAAPAEAATETATA
jgi:hypothetical protein